MRTIVHYVLKTDFVKFLKFPSLLRRIKWFLWAIHHIQLWGAQARSKKSHLKISAKLRFSQLFPSFLLIYHLFIFWSKTLVILFFKGLLLSHMHCQIFCLYSWTFKHSRIDLLYKSDCNPFIGFLTSSLVFCLRSLLLLFFLRTACIDVYTNAQRNKQTNNFVRFQSWNVALRYHKTSMLASSRMLKQKLRKVFVNCKG